MITCILVGPAVLVCVKGMLKNGSIVAYQDLQPEHANTARLALALVDNASMSAQEIYMAGLAQIYGPFDYAFEREDYATYGDPTLRTWENA